MGDFPILTAVTFLPLAGAVLIMLVRAMTGSQETDVATGNKALTAGLIFSVATFLASLVMLASFDMEAVSPSSAAFRNFGKLTSACPENT